ncbi:hypothetical protein [Rhodoferax sp. GW822-FHT02A01]|uniref:hypothetical protein n=1 Tax=Rhodoferax sp. GW822-FHT02A01 TaxID=3141537 RepID=UPI00315DF9D0
MNPYAIIAAILVAIGLFGAGEYDGQKRAHTTDALEIQTIKTEAASKLAVETQKTRNAEQALQAFTNAQNLKDADHEKTVADLHDQLRRAAGPSGRLRDPNATGCGAGGDSATGQVASPSNDSPADGAEAGGLLSTQLTGLLQRLQSEADTINDAYASCRAQGIADRSP